MTRSARILIALLTSGMGVLAEAHAAGVFPNPGPAGADPLLANLTIPANAATAGMWSPTMPWPIVGLHLGVMPDGRILSFGTPQNTGVQDGRTIDIWSPDLGFTEASHLIIANAQAIDSFCGTSAILPQTGSVLVSGGGSAGDGYQSFSSTLVNPARATVQNANVPLALQRWYATMITLADGRQLIGGGGTPYATVSAYADPTAALPNIAVTPEVFTRGKGWSTLSGASSTDAFGPVNNRAWYPRMWVGGDSTVFGLSTDKMWTLDPARNTIQTVGTFKTTVNATTLPNVGPTSTAVMYAPGKILQLGGNGYNNGYQSPSSRFATIIDIATPRQPVLIETNAMTYARQWANSLVLPDRRVLVTGGSTFGDNAGTNAVYPAELWDPRSGSWTVGASAANYRGYHSATVLLPDGAVLSTGGGVPGPVNNLNAEVYYPPYLFMKTRTGSALAARPRVVSYSSTTATYGGTLSLEMGDGSHIADASLIGLSSTTHSFNTSQRRVPLGISQQGTLLTATMPAAAALAPPGYYLLTVSNDTGVPSSSVIVGLNAAPAPQASVSAILPVDSAARSFELAAAPGNVVRHANFAAWLSPVSPQSDALSRDDASFYIRPGNANPDCYSFESKNYPGYFLRHQYFRVFLQAKDSSALYLADTTFCAAAGLSGTGFSLRSFNYPDHLLHVRSGNDVWIDTPDGTAAFRQAATFTFTQESLPIDAKVHAIASLKARFSLLRHMNFQGWMSSINGASLALDRSDASFYIRAGNADATCYSFEAPSYPGYFLRHQNGRLLLAQNDRSTPFAQSSTFCLKLGLAGSGFSLAPFDAPTSVLHTRADTGLYVDAADGTAAFADAASFVLAPAP